MAGELNWHPFPQEHPPVDVSFESDYLLIMSPRAVPPLVGYYDGAEDRFYLLGHTDGDSEMKDVWAWAVLPRIPAELYTDKPRLLGFARSANLIEEE
jgi:hypothetical protein